MRFGIATREISPPFRTHMQGYGSRVDRFDAINDPLTFTAVILEEGDKRALIGAADLCSFPNDGSTPALMQQLAEIVGCPVDNVLLNASHTHGGPHIIGTGIYHKKLRFLDDSRRYAEWLERQVADAVREAAANMIEGALWFGQGKTDLPMNRRPDRDGEVPNAPNPGGPVDDRMQLLVFRDAAGETVAVGMRVSCHPVATGDQHLITADYPGAWRAEFARALGPNVTPFFLQGAGADTRPRQAADGDAWRNVRHAELPDIGGGLLRESLAILNRGDLRPVEDLTLAGNISRVDAPCERRYTSREQIGPLLESESHIEREYAQESLRRLDAGEETPDHVAFMLQTLWLNRDFALITVDAEALCGLGAKVESAVAPAHAIFLGYTNGCVCYVPDTHEMKRGGYETISYLYQPWTGPLHPGLEDLFANAVHDRPTS